MKIEIVKSEKALSEALHIRERVFVEEQKVPMDLEQDGHDATALHVIGYLNTQAIATGRIRFIDDYGKLERIAVLKEYRGKSYGSGILRFMEEQILKKGYKKSLLNSQTHASEFYQRQGYRTVSEPFMDAGIPHVTMVKQLVE